MKQDFIFDMETSDPDDVLTLCLLANHKHANLRAVTVTPGTNEQIGLVKHVLTRLGLNIPVGGFRVNDESMWVSSYYYRWLGKFQPVLSDDEGYKVIQDTLANFPDTIIVTGAPLKNFTEISESMQLKTWIAQGGFAGDNIIPKHLRLEKFDGMISCPTFNFNGAPKVAESLLASSNIKEKYLVSKNVCHGVIYDYQMHEKFAPFKNDSAGINLAYQGMDLFLKKKANGKKFHDPLALAVAFDRSVCRFVEVEMYRKKGKWGAHLATHTNTFISISANEEKMIEILCQQK